MSYIATGRTVTAGELREWLADVEDDVLVYANPFDRPGMLAILNCSSGIYVNGKRQDAGFIDIGVCPVG